MEKYLRIWQQRFVNAFYDPLHQIKIFINQNFEINSGHKSNIYGSDTDRIRIGYGSDTDRGFTFFESFLKSAISYPDTWPTHSKKTNLI